MTAFQPVRRPTKRSSATPAAALQRSRSKRGAEISIGMLAVMILLGVGTYFLVLNVFGWHRDVALVAAGLIAGICSGGVLWPLWRSLRASLSRWISPTKTPGPTR